MDRQIMKWHRANELSRKLEGIPGVGPLVATALAAGIPDPSVFRSGRDLSAWIGLVPKQIQVAARRSSAVSASPITDT